MYLSFVCSLILNIDIDNDNDNYNDALTAFCHTSRLLPHVNYHVLMRSTTTHKSTTIKSQQSTTDTNIYLYKYITFIRTHTHTKHKFILCETITTGCMNKQRMMFKPFTNTVVDHKIYIIYKKKNKTKKRERALTLCKKEKLLFFSSSWVAMLIMFFDYLLIAFY